MTKANQNQTTKGGNQIKPNFVSPLLEKIARQMGIVIHIEPRYRYVGQITRPDGRKRYFRSTNFDINTLGASEIARDKSYAYYFMELMGYPIPVGETFFTDRWCAVIHNRRNPEIAYKYARRLGFPVIVKPNGKSQGWGVCKAYNKKEFMQAVRALSERENVFLIQKVATGRDYRIVVLDDEVISAYQRLPLSISGDGRSTVQQLLRLKQRAFQQAGRDTMLQLDDFRIANQLKRAGLSLRSIIQKGRHLELLPNANLSTGGDALDVTSALHPDWRRLAIQLTRDMNLRYCGVDVITEGSLKETPKSYVVLEVNAAPGLDHYASSGASRHHIVKKMYRQILDAMMR